MRVAVSRLETARSTRTSRSWAPAWPACPRRSSCERAGPLVRGARGARPRRRAPGVASSIGDGVWIDVGGQWVGPTQDRLYALARAHGAATFPTWTAGENVVELGGRLTRYTGTIPKLRPHVMADVGQAMCAARPDGEEGAARRALERAEGEAVGQPDGVVVDAPQHGDARPAAR